jgi:hypothetical protein
MTKEMKLRDAKDTSQCFNLINEAFNGEQLPCTPDSSAPTPCLIEKHNRPRLGNFP